MSYRLRALYQFGNSASVEILSNPLTRDQIIQAYQETYKPEEGDFIDLINSGLLNDIPIDDNLIANLENLYVEQCFLNLYTIFDTTENLGGFYGDMTIRIF